MSRGKRCEHEYVPVFEALYDAEAETRDDVFRGIYSTKQTACRLCGKRGPDNAEQEIFRITP